MKKLTRFIAIFIISVLVVQCFDYVAIQAKTKKVATPKISAKVSQKNKSVKITIDKTKNASWYVIEMCNTDIDTQYTKVKKLKKDGTAKRSYTKKNLEDGTYLIRVRAYAKNGKKTIKSEYSEVITVKVGKTSTPEPTPTPAPTGDGRYSEEEKAAAEAALKQLQETADLYGWTIIETRVLGNDGVYDMSRYGIYVHLVLESDYLGNRHDIDGMIDAMYTSKDDLRVFWGERTYGLPESAIYCSAFGGNGERSFSGWLEDVIIYLSPIDFDD